MKNHLAFVDTPITAISYTQDKIIAYQIRVGNNAAKDAVFGGFKFGSTLDTTYEVANTRDKNTRVSLDKLNKKNFSSPRANQSFIFEGFNQALEIIKI
jgi:hypothetical protein